MKLTTAKLLLFLTALYFAIRIPWLITLPVSESPDEPNHLWVVQFLVEHWCLPTAKEVLSGGTPAEYGSLPQLGYIPHVLAAFILKSEPITFAARLGSLFLGIITVWMAFLIGRKIFPNRALYRVALPTLIIVHPQLVFVHSYTNTDSTTVALSSVIIYLLVCSLKNGLSLNKAVAIGFLLGWAALSKHNGLSIVPAVFLSVLWACSIHQLKLKDTVTRLAIVFSAFGLTCSWWFIRNYCEFHGDILGSKTMYETWSKILPKRDGHIIHPWPPLNSFKWWRYVFFDFWGLFGYMNRYLWRPIYLAYLGLCLASIAGWLKAVKLRLPSFRFLKDPDNAVWLVFLVFISCNLIAMIYVTLINVSGPHGRYLFPSEIPIMALLLGGFSRLNHKFGSACTILTISICAVASVVSWLVFYPPSH